MPHRAAELGLGVHFEVDELGGPTFELGVEAVPKTPGAWARGHAMDCRERLVLMGLLERDRVLNAREEERVHGVDRRDHSTNDERCFGRDVQALG